MKFIHSLYRWGLLYILVILLVGSIFWVESLNIAAGDQDLLAFGFLVFFGFLIERWIEFHESDLLVSSYNESPKKENPEEVKKSGIFITAGSRSEKMK